MKQMQNQPVWVTEEEAARILQLSQGTLRTWRYNERRRGSAQKIPWKKFGGAVRYYAPALLEFKRENGNGEPV